MKSVRILLVEDNPDHADLTQQAIEDQNRSHLVHWVKDGQEAIDYLFRRGAYTNAPSPQLVLLDINLPKLTGIEVLQQIKEHPRLRVIPVVMLTTSDFEEDALKCYSLGANSFVTKPVQFDQFLETIQALKAYWTSTDRGLG